jgi:prepilin-type N-terminal cleavage/methylation domain-containing protein
MTEARTPTSTTRRRGFTLTEVLIVIGLILLVITIAIPAMSVIGGGRSVDAAQNMISAALARARQDAMALQEPHGIMFMPDVNTGRVVLAEVHYPGFRNSSLELDLVRDREELELPVGVGCQVTPHFNGAGAQPMPRIGVIMFDGRGRVSIRPFYVQAEHVTDPDHQNYNRLRLRLGNPIPQIVPGTNNANNNPLGSQGAPLTTQFGAQLFDQAAFDEAGDKAAFLKDNATPVLLNRYNGALFPSK